MRIKQTARKSTGPRDHDPMYRRQRILETKRASTSSLEKSKPIITPSPPPRHSLPSAPSRGKQITFSSRGKNLAANVKVKPRYKPGELALKQIKSLQKTWDLQIPRAAFHRLVREITMQLHGEDGTECDVRYQAVALEALQEAAESYLIGLFEDSYLCTIHAKRVTLFPTDMELCKKIRRSA